MKTKLLIAAVLGWPTILALILAIVMAAAPCAKADLIGQVNVTGDFTCNHLYDFNNPAAQPFGTFHLNPVSDVTGIFESQVSVGDILGGAGILNTVNNLPLFTLPGLQFVTLGGVALNGGLAGLLVVADMNIIGLNEDFFSAVWLFNAPSFDFNEDTTGPITLQLRAFSEVTVPDTGSTLALMSIALVGIFFLRQREKKV
jgi:VPDSG-CTERM motif